MQIRRIEVRSFRKLKHQVVDGLTPGLNVLVGDNEAGKSTLLAALRAVLFERHRVGGKVVQAMLPHGHEVRPEVTVDFTLGDGTWRLRKAFNQRPEAELTVPGGGTVTGDAVEDRMAALLGFAAPGNRGSKPEEHQGVYGLLWVDQGAAHGGVHAGGGQDALSSALEAEVGQVLGGERGRHLMARAEERRDSFWDKRDKPRGAFRQAGEDVEQLQSDLAALRERLRRHDDQVAALALRTEALARHRRDDRLNQAVRAVVAARARADRAAQLDVAVADLRRSATHALAQQDSLRLRLRERQTLAEQVTAGEASLARAVAASADVEAASRRAEDVCRQAATAFSEQRARHRALAERLEAMEAQGARHKAARELADASRRLADAEAAMERRRAARSAAAGVTLTAADLKPLDQALAARDTARSRRDAASVQIVVEAATATHVEVNGRAHAAAEPLLLASDAVLELPGFGRLRVRPGGGVAALNRAVEDAEAQVVTILQRLGFPSREAAAAALARKTEATATVAEQDRLLAYLTPDGQEALRQFVERCRTLVGAAPDGGDVRPPDPETLLELRHARDAAASAEQEAGDALKRSDGAREARARDAAVLVERLANLRREQSAASQGLAAARQALPDAELAGAAAEAAGAAGRAAEALGVAESALAGAEPEVARLELRRAEEAEKAIRADIERLEREKRDLEIELRTLGQDGLGEQLGDTEGRLAAARQKLATQSLQAEASLLLHRALHTASRETKDRWLGPVQDRVRPYLRLIQPGTEIVLNERTFGIEHLLRDGVPEPFESLSVGAREQVAVVTRLALAEVLLAAGQPAAIILDDALVNTDEGRLGRMHLVLQRAAERMQVLVLTCRERDFIDLGAPIHRL